MILAAALILTTSTALAATLLGGKDFIQRFLAPLSPASESGQWTEEELDQILQYAQRQEMELPEDIRKKTASSAPIIKKNCCAFS